MENEIDTKVVFIIFALSVLIATTGILMSKSGVWY